MEEEDLLKERIQAITDKRKIQEDIAEKRRDIEEEKLNLQYLKKKALREQWLMDGLSPQNDQEQEAMKLQAQHNQQQSKILQINIDRMEMEIEALEKQEMMISEKEQLIVKRLKEVEKTTADIIKAVNADIQQEPTECIYSEIPAIPKSLSTLQFKKPLSPSLEPNDDQPKQAFFAMEINVEKDMRTGESQVLSTATVTPGKFQQKGTKVYDDGRKSVYALHPDGQLAQNGAGELTPSEVEELLRKATEMQTNPDVEYHEPVFSTSYGSPSMPKKSDRYHTSSSPNGQLESPYVSPPYTQLGVPRIGGASFQGEAQHQPAHIPYPNNNDHVQPDQSLPFICSQSDFANGGENQVEANPQNPVQPLLQQSEENGTAAMLVQCGSRHRSPSPCLPDSPQSNKTAITENLDSSEPVTMIFMGYQSVDDEQETHYALHHDGAIQAELVVICDENDDGGDGLLSYHPDGCHSKIFQPQLTSKGTSYVTEAKDTCSVTNAGPYVSPNQLQETELRQSLSCLSPCPDGHVGRHKTDDPSFAGITETKKQPCSVM